VKILKCFSVYSSTRSPSIYGRELTKKTGNSLEKKKHEEEEKKLNMN